MAQKVVKKLISRDEYLFWFKPIYDCLIQDIPKGNDNFIQRVTIDDIQSSDSNDSYISLEILCEYGPFAVGENFDDFDVSDIEVEADKCTYNYYFSKKDFSLINSSDSIVEVQNPLNDAMDRRFELEDLDDSRMSKALRQLCENLGARLNVEVRSVMFDCGYPEYFNDSSSGSRSDGRFEPDYAPDICVGFNNRDLLALAKENFKNCVYSLKVKPCKNNEFDLIFDCFIPRR